VLAFEALNSAAVDPELLLTVELSAREGLAAAGAADLAFNEVAAANNSQFFVELLNHGTSTSRSQATVSFPTGEGSSLSGPQTLIREDF